MMDAGPNSFTSSAVQLAVAQMLLTWRAFGYAYITPDLAIAHTSPSFWEILDRPANRESGTPTLTLLLPEFIGMENELQAIRQGRHPALTLDHVNYERADGSIQYLSFQIAPLTPDQPPAGLLLLVEDVTASARLKQQAVQERNELRLAQAELRRLNDNLESVVRERAIDLALANVQLLETAETLQALIEYSPVAIIVTDGEGHVLQWSLAAEELLGWQRQEVVGLFLPMVPPDGLAEFSALRAALMRGHVFRGREVSWQMRSGERKDLSLSIAPLRKAADVITGFVGLLEDITERKRAEAEVRHLNATLEQRVIDRTQELQKEIAERQHAEEVVQALNTELSRSNADLEQFAYLASHDLQEPLRMVNKYMQLLRKRYTGRLDADADEFIRFASEGAQRMEALIKGLLAYARVGRQNEALTVTDCNAVAQAALANLQGNRI